MTPQTMKEAVAEAKRFIKSVERLNEAFSASLVHGGYSTPKQSGAVRRASMDLTRKLADLRAGR